MTLKESKPAEAPLSEKAERLLIYLCARGGHECIAFAPRLKDPYFIISPRSNWPDSIPASIKHPEKLAELVEKGFVKVSRRDRGPIRAIYTLTRKGRCEGTGAAARKQ